MSKEAVKARIDAVHARMAWLSENLRGCDWCCGGGDEEMAALKQELAKLNRRSAIVNRTGSVVRVVGRL